MSQLDWTYVDDYGEKYEVGIHHVAPKGHVVVNCNNKIMIIDFNVLRTKTYSFFLGPELCELNVRREKENFSYGLTINEEADTPLNQLRRKYRKRDLFWTLLIFSMLLASVFLFSYTFLTVI